MSAELQLDNRCHHTSADGRRCRMLRREGDPSLCPEHRRLALQPEMAPETAAAELLSSIENFQSAIAINQALGRLFALLASNRIAPRHAAILAYIGQLLLNTLPTMKDELISADRRHDWYHMLHRALKNLRRRKSPCLAEMVLKPATQARDDNSGESNP